MTYARGIAVALLVLGLAFSSAVLADDASDDPILACDRAAARAEAEWHLPTGLLSAIGAVESGRSGLGSVLPVAWPWTVNAGGRGLYLPDRAAAIAAVRTFRSAGVQLIDVGCFQVDLFYHPQAFPTLDVAFEPEANAQAAARILTLARLSGRSWEAAIALYHSAVPMRGAQYLRQVQAVWPLASARAAAGQDGAYAMLLSPAARGVRVIIPTDMVAQSVAVVPVVLAAPGSAVVQWTTRSADDLPIVLMPSLPRGSARTQHGMGGRGK